jgi:hypothetical protein
MRHAGMGLRPVDVAFGFPVRSPAKGIGGDVIVAGGGAVQVLGVPVSGDHVRSAGIPRCLRVPVGDVGVLSREHAARLGVGASIDPAPDRASTLAPASLQIEVMPLLGCVLTKTGALTGTANLKMHWGAGGIALGEQQLTD